MKNYFSSKITLQIKTYYHMHFPWKTVKKVYVNMNSNNLIPLKVVHVFVTDV